MWWKFTVSFRDLTEWIVTNKDASHIGSCDGSMGSEVHPVRQPQFMFTHHFAVIADHVTYVQV